MPSYPHTTTTTTMTPTQMISGAFVLKMKTPQWHLCVVKQAPDQSASSWMLFGQQRRNQSRETFQMEFMSHQETMMIAHLVKLAMTDSDDESYADLRLVLVAESPAISCIGSLWPLKGLEMYRNRFHTPSSLSHALHQEVYMLGLSPQIQQSAQTPQSQQSQQSHPMQTRSKRRGV